METTEKKKNKLMSMIAPEETPEQAALREACDAFVLQACNRIRQDMEEEKTQNRLRYDQICIDRSSQPQAMNPHYRVHWDVEVDVDFKKKEKFYEFGPDQKLIRFGFAIPVFYILEEMEKNLAVDGIVPIAEKEKRVGLFRKSVGKETVKMRLHRAEICNGLEAASRDYSAGFTTPHLNFVTGSDFAYFVKNEHNEERK